MLVYHDGSNSYITNAEGALKIATETSGIAVTIGHSTSEVTIGDNLTVTGDLTIGGTTNFGDFNITNVGSIALDTITNDGTDITLDSSGDIILDAAGNDVLFKAGGTTIGEFTNSSSDLVIKSSVSDKDMLFKGNDGGAAVTALTLDMSEAGAATFNSNVAIGGNATVTGNLTVNGTTTTLATTNSVISDRLIELGNGTTGTPGNDMGIVLERGDSDNAFIGWDESADKFIVGTGSFTGASTGNLTITTGTLVANLEGAVTGNASTATALANARTIGGTSFDGTANIAVNLAATATTLATARNIGGVSFDGSANIDLPGVNSSGNQDTSGNAATATALANARTIAGQSFDGTGNITIASTDLSNTSAIALLTASQTLTNKTLTSPVIAAITSTADIDLTATNDVNIPANVGLTFGDDGEKIEGNGTLLTIASSNNLVFDVANDILLDAGNGAWYFNDDGTTIGSFTNSSSDFVLKAQVQDKDLIFQGNDGGSVITALTLDMSEGGRALFTDDVLLTTDNKSVKVGAGNDLSLTSDGSELEFQKCQILLCRMSKCRYCL